jgi:hypothetical protein
MRGTDRSALPDAIFTSSSMRGLTGFRSARVRQRRRELRHCCSLCILTTIEQPCPGADRFPDGGAPARVGSPRRALNTAIRAEFDGRAGDDPPGRFERTR